MKIRIRWENGTTIDHNYSTNMELVDMESFDDVGRKLWIVSPGSPWIVGCGGKEPITEIEGYRYQMHWNPITREHKYYCFNTDLFLDNDQLPQALRG